MNKIKYLTVTFIALMLLIAPINLKAQNTSTGKGKAILLSAIYPGWGIYSQNKSAKASLLLGVATYTTAAAAYFNYNKAVEGYDNYLLERKDPHKRNEIADQWELDYKKSFIFGTAAVGIWVGSMAYTILLKNKAPYSLRRRKSPFKIGCNYNPYIKSPVMALQVNF